MNILVIDAQGGGIGRQLVTAIREKMAEADITAVGTNTVATAAMLKAGADNAATGENAVVVNTRRADVIVGPIGIVIADAMFGEITPRMANAVVQCLNIRDFLLKTSTRFYTRQSLIRISNCLSEYRFTHFKRCRIR